MSLQKYSTIYPLLVNNIHYLYPGSNNIRDYLPNLQLVLHLLTVPHSH
jgi:hypothetical protein